MKDYQKLLGLLGFPKPKIYLEIKDQLKEKDFIQATSFT